MKRMNKKGQWQNYLLPAILAVIVLGISFYFIFNELFIGGGMDREVCKESIMVRSALPNVKMVGFVPTSFKDEFPLKCKTNVVEITKKDVEDKKVDSIIGDALAECWFLFERGDANPFPSTVFGANSACLPCARIHLTEDAKKTVEDGKIDIEGLLNDINLFEVNGKKTSYINYLNSGKTFYPFNPMGTGEFNLSGENFTVKERSITKDIFLSFPKFKTKLDSNLDSGGAFANVTLPKYMEVDRGDLIISIGVVTTSNEYNPDHIPYMFYFQNGQKDYMDEMNKKFIIWRPFGIFPVFDEKICNMWEGIPA